MNNCFHTCPACGQAVASKAPVHVDLNSNTAVIGPNNVLLAPKEAEILFVIADKHPGYAPVGFIMSKIYGAQDCPGARIIHVMISKLRKKLKPYGVLIQNRHSKDFELSQTGGYKLFAQRGKTKTLEKT